MHYVNTDTSRTYTNVLSTDLCLITAARYRLRLLSHQVWDREQEEGMWGIQR